MLSRENQLRLSPEIQETYRLVEAGELDKYESWMEVTNDLQKRVISEFLKFDKTSQIEQEIENQQFYALQQLRASAHRNPDLALYVRFNRSRKRDMTVGDYVPNVPLCSIHNSDVSMLHQLVPLYPTPYVKI